MEKKVVMAPDKGITKYYPADLAEERAWTDGNNVQFGVGYISKATGWEAFLPARASWKKTSEYRENDYCVPLVADITMTIEEVAEGTKTDYYYLVTWPGHGLSAGSSVRFYTTGKLFDGVLDKRNYYVVSGGLTTDAFRFSEEVGGAALGDKDATQSGTHTASKNDHVYKCTTEGGGMSGLTEPLWPTDSGATMSDGSLMWKEVGVRALTGTLQAIDNYYRRDGFDWLMFVTTKKVYRYDKDEKTFVDLTGGSDLNGTCNFPVFSENAANWFVFTNGVDPVKFWDGNMAVIANLPGMNDCEPGPEGAVVTAVTAKCLIYWNNFLILGDTTETSVIGANIHRPQRIRWSRLGDITAWKNDEDGNGEAGAADLTEGVDWVQAMRPLGSYLVVYKERSIQVLSYVGGDLIWDKRPAIIGTGLLAPQALCDLGDEHIFVGPDNFYSFDGIEPKIAGDDVAKEYFRVMDPSYAGLTNSFFIEEVPEIWFIFASMESNGGFHDRALVYNTDTKAWSWRDAPMMAFGYYIRRSDVEIDDMDFTIDSWDTQIDSSLVLDNSPINLCGDANGFIYVLAGNSFDGENIVSFATSKLFDFDQPGHVKRLLRVQLMISREGEGRMLPVYVGTANNVDEDVIWHGPYGMNLDKTYPPWIDVDISSRYFCIKFGTVLKDEPFKLTGYIFYYNVRGDV